MQKYQITYKDLSTGERNKITLVQHTETGVLYNQDSNDELVWANIIQISPNTGRFLTILAASPLAETEIAYTYDNAGGIKGNLTREQIMGSPGLISVTPTSENMDKSMIQVGKVEPLFVPSLTTILVQLEEVTGRYTERDSLMKIPSAYVYKPNPLGVITGVVQID